MNFFLLRLPNRATLFLLTVLLSAFLADAGAQSGSPYKRLSTAQGIAAADTVSGVDLGITVVSPTAQHGTVQVTILQNGGSGQPYVYRVAYTPTAGYVGVDTFVIELNYVNAYPYQSYQAYQVHIYPSVLQAKPDYAVTDYATPVSVNVLANDIASNGPMTLTALPVVDFGTASFTGAGQVTFSPNPTFYGATHIQYTVCDALNFCRTGTLSIGVEPAWAPFPDTLRLAAARNTPLTIPLNYTSYSVFQAPAHGTVQLVNGNRAFRYVPNANYAGADPFVLRNDAVSPAIYLYVDLTVLFVPPVNKMAIEDLLYTPQGQGVSFNVRDNDLGNLTVKSWIPPAPAMGTISGTMPDGTVTFTPAANFVGVATFYYKIGNLFAPDLETGTVRVVVSNLPPSAPVFDLTTPKNTPLVIDYAVPFNAFEFVVTDAPDHGTCTFFPGYSSQNINGQTVAGTNLLIYSPQPGFTGLDQWEAEYCFNGQCQPVGAVMHIVNTPNTSSLQCLSDCVWPGDANADGIVNNRDLLAIGYHSGQRGPARANASGDWYGQGASDWDNPFDVMPYDLKHVDTNGDGEVSAADTVALNQHYRATPTITPQIPAPDKGLPFFFDLLTPNPQIGDLVQVLVRLGSPQFPVTDLRGFTLDVTISPQIVDSLLGMHYMPNSWINYDAPYLSMSETPFGGRVESAFCRVTALPTQGFGPIGRLEFIIIDIVEGGKPGGDTLPHLAAITFDPSAVQWGNGAISQGTPVTLEIPLPLRTASVARPASDDDLLVYPSPATSQVSLHLNGDELIQSLVVTDLLGRVVYHSGSLQTEHIDLNVLDWMAGNYVVFARTKTGTLVKRFQVAQL